MNPSGAGTPRPSWNLGWRSEELTRRWSGLLREQMRVAPERVFPGDDVLDSIPEVVEQILSTEGTGFSHAAVERIHELARLRLRQFIMPEQVFAQLGGLEEILFDALEEEFDSLESPPDWNTVLSAGRAISRNLHRTCAVMALALLEETERIEEAESVEASERDQRAERAEHARRREKSGEAGPPYRRGEPELGAPVVREAAERPWRARVDEFTEFTQIVHHELRDPLSSAFAAARILRDVGEDLSERERSDILDTIPRNIQRATQLLESLHSLKTPNPPGGPESVRSRRLRELVDDLLQELDEPARRASVDVRVGHPLPDDEVEGDRTALILHNLVLNAIKYADPGKDDRWVRIDVDEAEVEEEEKEGNGGTRARRGFRVQIRDNGVGIEPEEQERIFERFYRVAREGTPGTGLGLVIAREAARQLGSEIEIESRPGQGSTFSFVAPCPGGMAASG